MRDLWNDLARRLREANRVEQPEMPFGFADAVLRRLQTAGREAPNLLDEWAAVLRPALGLAFGTALLCFLLQKQVEAEMPSDAITQTEALIQLAVLDE